MSFQQTDRPPARAATLTLVGGVLALDFANTASDRGGSAHIEHLRHPGDLAAWLAHAGVTPANALEAGHEEALFAAALALREAIYAVMAAIAMQALPDPAASALLVEVHAAALAKTRLIPANGHLIWDWAAAQSPKAAVLGPIAHSAIDLLTQKPLARLRQCAGAHCGWLFYDTTKNGRRRWCDMEVCGNRAKAKTFRARKISGEAIE